MWRFPGFFNKILGMSQLFSRDERVNNVYKLMQSLMNDYQVMFAKSIIVI